MEKDNQSTIRAIPNSPNGRQGWPWTIGEQQKESISKWLAKRTDWPKVSIVMPSYNQGEFIEESVRSVLLQGYPKLEFIGFAAEATDGSDEIIKEYARWVTYWVGEKDDGQSDAINKGLLKSTGRYFNWKDPDDVLTPCSLFMAVDT